MDILDSILRFFQNGGDFMSPILLVLALGLAITIERMIYLRRAHSETRILWSRKLPLVNQRQYEEAEKMASSSSTAIGRVLGYGSARSRIASATRADVELAMEVSVMVAAPALERRTRYLATFANIST